MDAMCETLMLEEILPRLPPKSLLRLGATSRRYGALARSPGFAARYWRRAGAFLQPAAEQPAKGVFPRFLTAHACRGGGRRARRGPRRGRLGHRALGGRRPAAVLEGPHLADGALLRLQPGDAAAHGSPGAAGLLLQAAVRAPDGDGGWHRRHVPGGRHRGVAI